MEQNNSTLERRDRMGFFTHPGSLDEYLAFIRTHITRVKAGAPALPSDGTVYYHNLHTIYLYLTSQQYRNSFDNKTVLLDGMGALFLYKLVGLSLPREKRLTYVDFILPLMETARNNEWRVFHVGQNAEVLNTALSTIREKVPGINIDGHHGYFDLSSDSVDSATVIEKINANGTDLLLVGLGSPAQELWVDALRNEIHAPMVMVCGSCMDYVAGNVKTAPRWMGRAGIEMLFRLYADPKRLAFRYLVEPFLLMFVLLRNGIQSKWQ